MTLDVHTNEAAGDILVFLTGKFNREIHYRSTVLGQQFLFVSFHDQNYSKYMYNVYFF